MNLYVVEVIGEGPADLADMLEEDTVLEGVT